LLFLHPGNVLYQVDFRKASVAEFRIQNPEEDKKTRKASERATSLRPSQAAERETERRLEPTKRGLEPILGDEAETAQEGKFRLDSICPTGGGRMGA